MKEDTNKTLADRCFDVERAESELFETIHFILTGTDITGCSKEGFVWGCTDCWVDEYDTSVEIVGNFPLNQEQANKILDLGFGCIYESCEGQGRVWNRRGWSRCSPREGDQDKQIRAELNDLRKLYGKSPVNN